ncbi:hypothetical protein Bhyg_15539 [Pseudolycoriella hygida]|uniref:Uncharacterized protein n=1 Tax=Pseudolycoriella hygida TaxID=35572 RepID=A0A9Q0MP28_9DIPT|nr:hypothetical protein Bhyg_15539 [Pseudolycoriella hygida]
MKLFVIFALLFVGCQATISFTIKVPASPKFKLPAGFTIKLPVIPTPPAVESEPKSTEDDTAAGSDTVDTGAAGNSTDASGTGSTGSSTTTTTSTSTSEIGFKYIIAPGFEIILPEFRNIKYELGKRANKSKSGSKSDSKSKRSKEGDDEAEDAAEPADPAAEPEAPATGA